MTSDTTRNDLKIFGGTSIPELTARVCEYLNVPLGLANIGEFPDGERLVKCMDDVRGRDCFIIQSTCPPVDNNLMELLIFIDCLRRASASRITAVIPYFGYARQDRKDEGRTPITAKLVANMIATAGADRVLTMDLHAEQIQGFFDIPLDNLTAVPVVIDHFRSLKLQNTVFLSPDVGNLKIANVYSSELGGELAVIGKRRISGETVEARHIIGDVEGATILIFDDMITTAGTLASAVKLVRKCGAKQVYATATHAILCGPAVDRLREANLSQLCVTDTVPLSCEKRDGLRNLTVLSVAPLIGEAIRRIHEHRSVSELFTSSSVNKLSQSDGE